MYASPVSVLVAPGPRAPLSRQQVLLGALRYIDEQGLAALSMHKLGAALGVKGMSLYKHVADKNDLLDGLVDVLWAEIDDQPPSHNWRQAIPALARALRALVHRHPHAAPLLTSRMVVPRHAVRIMDSYLRIMREAHVPERCAVSLLRAATTYGIGYALTELTLPQFEPTDPANPMSGAVALLGPGAPENLVRTAYLVCVDCDLSDQFDIGIDLMVGGLEAYLASIGAAPTGDHLVDPTSQASSRTKVSPRSSAGRRANRRATASADTGSYRS